MAVILLVGFVQLILVPVLTKLASFVTPSLAKAGHWVGRQFLKVGVFHKLRKLLGSLAPKESSIAVYERTLTRFKGSAELYIAHAIVITLLVILLVWGGEKSQELGLEVAKLQLANSPRVEIVYGDNEKIESTLCGRIGTDYILRSVDQRGQYVILKEPTIKSITILQPQQKNP